MKKLSLLFFLITSIAQAQLTTVPALANTSEEFKIIFDASNTALANTTEELYAHTGVSSNDEHWIDVIGDWGDNTVQPKFTKTDTNLYELVISPDVYAYYSVDSSVDITGIDMVVRTADASNQTGDLSITLYNAGFNLVLQSPVNNSFYKANESIEIIGVSTQTTTFEIYADDQLIQTVADSKEMNTTYSFSDAGNHSIKLKASYNDETKEAASTIYISENSPMPEGLKDGININSDQSVTFVLTAPAKKGVFLLGEFNNWTPSSAYMMKMDDDKFWITLNDLDQDYEYAYSYMINDAIIFADPHTTKVLDPNNDQYIPETVYPNLKEYPQGAQGIVSTFIINKPLFTWSDDNFNPKDNNKAVVYELLIRDFTEEGSYKAAIEKLDYLVDLGITAIELMPVNEFEGNDSWGYNPSFYKALDKAYGTENDLKSFINACHNRGISVFLDVVFNHSFGQSPLLAMYWDGAANKPAADNPWYNQESNFENPNLVWGQDFNHESEYTVDFFEGVISYWIEEFHIDGYRLDFTKGLSNTPHPISTDEWGSNYDQDRIDILEHYTDYTWENHGSDIMMIFEHLAENSEEKVLADYGIFLWGNINYNWTQNTMGYSSNSDVEWANYKNRDWTEPQLVAYMESHDEQRLMFENLENGNSSGNYRVRDLNTALARQEAAHLIHFNIQGPKMIWQFGELGYDVSIDEGGRTGKKPVRWEYYDNNNRRHLYTTLATINKLRENYPDLQSSNYTFDGADLKKSLAIDGESIDFALMANFDVNIAVIEMNFPSAGSYYEYFTGEIIEVDQTQVEFRLNPGEYRLYSTTKLNDPLEDGSGDTDKDGVQDEFDLCPNTLFGIPVNESGCPLLVVPENNYTIESIGESCQGENNGQISLTTLENHNYILTFNNQEYTFTSSWSAENLAPGSYELSIQIEGEDNYKQVFVSQVAEAPVLTATSEINVQGNKGLNNIEINSGTAPYAVYLNDQFIFETDQNELQIRAESGDKITVESSVLCEGKIEHYVPVNPVSIYPNPVETSTNISLVHPELQEVEVYLINQLGLTLKSFTLKKNETQQLNLNSLKQGVYYLKFNNSILPTQRLIKI
ncbi:MAG: alpha-amylase family glycosyl hydrolase [Flavobacteriaceae bacterium]